MPWTWDGELTPQDTRGISPTNQCLGAKSGEPSLSGVLSQPTWQMRVSPQIIDHDVLYKQTKGGSLLSPVPGSAGSMGILHSSPHSPGSLLSTRCSERGGGPPEQILHQSSRVVHPTRHLECSFPEMGFSLGGAVCDQVQ